MLSHRRPLPNLTRHKLKALEKLRNSPKSTSVLASCRSRSLWLRGVVNNPDLDLDYNHFWGDDRACGRRRFTSDCARSYKSVHMQGGRTEGQKRGRQRGRNKIMLLKHRTWRECGKTRLDKLQTVVLWWGELLVFMIKNCPLLSANKLLSFRHAHKSDRASSHSER